VPPLISGKYTPPQPQAQGLFWRGIIAPRAILDPIERDSERAAPQTDNGRQLKRYRAALPNLLLTDYLEFRRYRDGARHLGLVDGRPAFSQHGRYAPATV